jgi:MFS family permease
MNEARRTRWILSIVVFLVMLGVAIIIPAVPLYAREFGASDLLVGALISAFGVARVVLDLPAGGFVQRASPKRVLEIGLALVVLSSIVAGFAPSYAVLLASRVVEGVGSALFMVAGIIVILMVSPPDQRGRALSLFTTMLLLGASFGPSLGGLVVPLYGANAPFFLYAGLVAVGWVVTRRWLRLPRQGMPVRSPAGAPVVRTSVRDRSPLLLGVGTFALAFQWAGIGLTVAALYAYDNLRVDAPAFGVALALMTLANLGTTVVSGPLTDRLGRRLPLTLSLVGTAATIFALPFTVDYLQFLGVVILFGLVSGFWGQTGAWAADLAVDGRFGPALGFNRMAADLGFVVAPLLLGFLTEVTRDPLITHPPFTLTALLCLAGAGALARTRDPARRNASLSPEPRP